MGKSRVEKNKELYEELDSNVASHHGLDLDAFELEDLGDVAENEARADFDLEDLGDIQLELSKVEQENNPVKEDIKSVVEEEPKLEVKETEPEEEKVPVLTNEEYIVEQPVGYNKMLIAEEVLRSKLEKQKELKDNKRGLKRSPVTDTYTAEAMQKNIKQNVGVDVRKELNIRIKKTNGRAIAILVILLIAIVAAGIALTYFILKN